jgi:Sec-independent protein secretion pathway component TatC
MLVLFELSIIAARVFERRERARGIVAASGADVKP